MLCCCYSDFFCNSWIFLIPINFKIIFSGSVRNAVSFLFGTALSSHKSFGNMSNKIKNSSWAPPSDFNWPRVS